MISTNVRPPRSVGALALMAALAVVARAQDTPPAPGDGTAPPAARWALIVCGIPGDEEHHEQYSATIESLHASLTERLGFPSDNVRIQFGAQPTAADGPAVAAARGRATRRELAAEIEDLRRLVQPADTLWIVVLGHAHFDGRKAYLNLPGAGDGQTDIDEDEFGKLFEGLAAWQQVFFVTTPVSGFFIRPLSAKGRIVVTATEADREVNETLFHAALAEVLAKPPEPDALDVDRDGRITLFDVYIHVTRNVADRYVVEMLLSTEHAQLDDNGDGRGTELQLDYLTEPQGGRATEGTQPPAIRPNSDGYGAQQIVLPLALTAPPAEKQAERQ